LKGFQRSCVTHFQERSTNLSGHIHTTTLPTFGTAERTAIPTPLNEKESVGIFLVPAELNIAPLQTKDFALP
jgi:hypothetical protein